MNPSIEQKINIPLTKIFVILILISALVVFWIFDLANYLNIDYLKSQQQAFESYYQKNPISTVVLFFLTYVFSVAISFPGATVLSLLAGALFGLFWGTLVVSFASTVGATIAFLASRIVFQDYFRSRFPQWDKKLNEGFEKDGSFYLFTLRLMPIVPFFILNLLMGLTPISVLRYFWVSQLGMVFGTVVYVNAGLQISKLNSLQEILSVPFIFSCILLGVFPFLIKGILNWLSKQRNK